LLPPDVRDWLPTDHLAWFVIDAAAQMDLTVIYRAYRADGHGRAAYEPSMTVTLLLYAYATKQRSSRAIECHCRQDVAYRVITGNVVPDHATIARFVVRHEVALGELFGEVLKLCDPNAAAHTSSRARCWSTPPGVTPACWPLRTRRSHAVGEASRGGIPRRAAASRPPPTWPCERQCGHMRSPSARSPRQNSERW
jgi:transposase